MRSCSVKLIKGVCLCVIIKVKMIESLLASGEISETKSNATENERLWELRSSWLLSILSCSIRVTIRCLLLIGFLLFLVTVTIDIILTLLDSELQVEELSEVAQQGYTLLSDAPQLD